MKTRWYDFPERDEQYILDVKKLYDFDRNDRQFNEDFGEL